MRFTKGALLVLTHSRASLLSELFQSIKNLENPNNVPILVVQQSGFNDVTEEIKTNESLIKVSVKVVGDAKTIAENISQNRLAGYSLAFNALGVDWVLAVEDDVVLSRDALNFAQHICDRFSRNKNFRGVNLGSRLELSDAGINSFSKTRFGVLGQGSVITSHTWKNLIKYGVIDTARNTHWDSAMESYIKTGFMVVPNNSRYLDRGHNGTHMDSNLDAKYFQDLEKSFVGLQKIESKNYYEADLNYWWRDDLKKYNSVSNLKFWLVFLLLHFKLFSGLKRIIKLIFRIKLKLLNRN